MFNRIALAALPFLAFTAAIGAPVAAQSTAKVAIGDLNLTTEAGRATMEARLASAVRNVCGPRPMHDLSQIANHRQCIRDARESYQEQVRIALNNANARRVAVLADKLGFLASF